MCGSRLFQLLHGLQLHVLAHLIKPLDHVGVTSNSKVFAFFKQELLVDEIAQDVLFTLAKQLVGVGRILLFNVVLQLVLAAEELRPGDDRAVHARDNFFNYLTSGEGWNK